jgi:hypothetical protein
VQHQYKNQHFLRDVKELEHRGLDESTTAQLLMPRHKPSSGIKKQGPDIIGVPS